MELSSLTARQMYEALRANPRRKPFGFGRKAAIVNVDFQRAFTQVGVYSGAYENDPSQYEHTNALCQLARDLKWPVVWTTLAYLPDGSDCGVWGRRTDTPDSLQRITLGSDRAALDPRLHVDERRDLQIIKKMPSAFHGTPLASYLVAQGVDTVIITGGSTSGCIRATAVDSLSNGFITIVAEECVADVHESPHYASLYDLQAKYADVLPAADVRKWLKEQQE